MTTTSAGLKFASAVSDVADTRDAQREVLHSLTKQLGDRSADLLIVFATPHHADGLADACNALQTKLHPRVLIGASVSGVIGICQELQEGPGLSVLAGQLPGASLQGFSYEQFDWPAIIDAPEALRDAIHFTEDANDDGKGPRAILMLADPFSTPMVRLLPAFSSSFPGVPVIGGMASGAQNAGQNTLILNGQPMHDGAVGIAIGGRVDVQTTVSQGCRAVGKPFVITKSHRHVVKELGGQNPVVALQEMVATLDSQDRELIQRNGLLVGRVINEYKSRFGRGDFLIRNMVGVDADEGYIAIGDTRVRTGQTIQFHIRDAQGAEDDLRMMLSAQQVHGEAQGALLFTCTGRGTHLFPHRHADAGMIHDALGPVPLAGAFCAGEIGPVGPHSHLHGHTACLAVFRSSG